MSTASTQPDVPPSEPDSNPFRLGWRYIRRVQPDGTDVYDEVPLKPEHLLYPQEGDRLVTDDIHDELMHYIGGALKSKFAGDPHVVVRRDGLVAWATDEVQPLGPDVIVFFDVPERHRGLGTFRVPVEGGRPVLAVEITSPDTRPNDLGPKVDLYERAGIEWYLIIDRRGHGDPTRLVGYRFSGGRVTLEPDDAGRLWIETLGIWFALRDGRVSVIDGATGERILDSDEANLRAETERRRAEDADRRAEDADRRVEDERRRADDLAERVRHLEEELRRLHGNQPRP